MKTITAITLSTIFTCLTLAGQATSPTPEQLEAARRYSESCGGQAMVVLLDGKIVFESYANGGGKDRAQMLASGTKSFVGVVAVAAVEDGIIKLDDPACESLTEWKTDPVKSQITYRQLLTLTSGLTPGERGSAVRSPGWKEIVAKPMAGKPGAQFAYGAYHLCAFAEALQRKLKNETFEAYLNRRILQPLGIKLEWRWRCADGNPQVGGAGAMTARDWAVFGEFMRLGGQWEGKQIIRKELLAECQRGTKQNPAYGLTWWLRQPVPDLVFQQVPLLRHEMGDILKADWLPDDLFMAAGAGKQRLYVIPSRKLVIVRQGDLMKSRDFSDVEFLRRLWSGTETPHPVPAARATAEEAAPAPKIERFQLTGEQWTCLADGQPLSGVLLKPSGTGPFPSVILSHGLGGNAAAMAANRGREMVTRGYVVIATDYTHAGKPGAGRQARGAIDYSQVGASRENIRRALACLEILRQQKDVDPRRVFAHGHSMGAFLTIALVATTDKIAAAAITAGGIVPDGVNYAAPTVSVAGRVRTPMLILHGSADTTVPPSRSVLLKEVLDKNKVPNDRIVFEGAGHNLPSPANSAEVYRLIHDWFTRHSAPQWTPR